MKQLFIILVLFGILASCVSCTDTELETEVEQLRDEFSELSEELKLLSDLQNEDDILYRELIQEYESIEAELAECLALSGTPTPIVTESPTVTPTPPLVKVQRALIPVLLQ